MTRLRGWFIKFNSIKGRKQARYQAYNSEIMGAKMRVVKREQAKGKKGGR